VYSFYTRPNNPQPCIMDHRHLKLPALFRVRYYLLAHFDLLGIGCLCLERSPVVQQNE